jgi:signal transduction histidine kinase
VLQPKNRQQSDISPRLQTILQQVVDDVVERLGCAGALATTLERDKGLYLRASAFNLPPEELQQLLKQTALPTNRRDAIVYVDDERHQSNLSVAAIRSADGRNEPYRITGNLYDLFRPLAEESSAIAFQEALNIEQAVAVPFVVQHEIVGTLIALSADEFTSREIDFLVAFGHQAAAAVQSNSHLTAMEALERVILTLQARMTDEVEVLQTVVDAVVYELGYQGAMVATLEEGNALPVRAYAIDSTSQLLNSLEKMAGVKLIGPRAVVYLDDPHYQENLSVRAVKGLNGRPQNYLISDTLYDLLRPIAPKPIADLAQKQLGIKQVIAVPFFLEDEVVGNLFVASRRPTFTAWEISLLTSFGQQAAAGIRNARLYREAEQQRQIAEQFGRMAFSATASVHALGNHISAVRTYLHLLSGFANYSDSQKREILQNSFNMSDRLRKASEMLDKLHEPWKQEQDTPVSVNDCLVRALNEVYPQLMQGEVGEQLADLMGAHIHIMLRSQLPPVYTAADMLTEAFRIVLKNARDAIRETGKTGDLWIATETAVPNMLCVRIEDNGIGIRSENLPHIFDMGWTTKKGQGMGFGLFWARDYIYGLGGRIDISSQPKKGTTFLIYLPISTTGNR